MERNPVFQKILDTEVKMLSPGWLIVRNASDHIRRPAPRGPRCEERCIRDHTRYPYLMSDVSSVDYAFPEWAFEVYNKAFREAGI